MSDELKKEDTIDIEKTEFVDDSGAEEAIINNAFSKNEVAVPAQLFIDEDERVHVEIDILSEKSTGKIISVFKKGSFPIEDMKSIFGHSVETFDFSIPNFDDVTLYRQQSSNNTNRTVDKNVFRNFLMAMHLKDWSLKGKDGKKIELDFEVNGNLTKESLKIINKVPTVIWDVVLTIFERETLIS